MPEQAFRRREIPSLVEQDPEVQERFSVRRVELVHPAEAPLGFAELAVLAQGQAEVVQRRRVVRRDIERAAVALDCPGEVARSLAGIALLLEVVGGLRGQGA
jgi:hypothetical protein